MYLPSVTSKRLVAFGSVGSDHLVRVFDGIESEGRVEYEYLLYLYERGSEEPCLCVSSELNRSAKVFGDGSHFFCVFHPEGHFNRGDADKWADLKSFAPAALKAASDFVSVDVSQATLLYDETP